ncbi:hypothetical protein OC834_003692 [Tilletia horrida]|uniref:Dienelactone hydrolase domain-containing protein n=1 Tax=Tilletia horrida TaxID=155126 RepID=A0AAN6G6I2_9BASI|nr:hypothetical protein OC842_005903 [Tilletia horrida]KAK0529431.1 hypothetical protein OC834_003692 [Tilletia horrida]KAK0557389.1 hypothetical protein OC844_005603 [Tilletia horrida]
MAANTNKACCTIPPVKSDYSDFKGAYETIEGLNTYVTGDASSKKAIVATQDIFGQAPQTKQGADIVAAATGARVYLPDYFHGKPIPQEAYPPKTKEHEELIQNFFGGIAAPPKNKEILVNFAKELKKRGATSVGAYGFCWGGKVSILAGGEGTPFSAVAQVHPAMLSADDASALKVPVGNYPSGDEAQDDIDAFQKAVEGNSGVASQSDFKHYKDQHHGWAAARADLDKESNKKAYEDVYSRLGDFFNKHL